MFFFFFKQKTAYEVRISDWSSDVCSSDLDEQVERTLRHDRLEPGDNTEEVSREVASLSVTSYGFGEETLVAGKGFHGCGLADRGRAGRTLTLQFVDGADQSGISESVSESPPGHGMRLGRSEEHTSELQSLMRISYA